MTSTLPDVFSPLGLNVSGPLSFEEWDTLGHTLGSIQKATPWLLGDWHSMGLVLFGEESAQGASSELGVQYSTIQKYGQVASRIPPQDRRLGLSWYAHQQVAWLKPADRNAWLDKAEQGSWDSTRLRAELLAAKALPERVGDDPAEPPEISAREALTMIRSDPVWAGVASAALATLTPEPAYEIATCPLCKHQFPLL